MSFLKFFWRDFKSDKTYNWFYILCASLGIIGLLLVESFKTGVEEKVTKNAKNFIASDLSISSRRNFEEREKKIIENQIFKYNAHFAKWIETYSLVSGFNNSSGEINSRLADLNFVTEDFPYYGGVELEKSGFKGPNDWSEIHLSPVVWIGKDLAFSLKLNLNDKIKIGDAYFQVKGIITDDKFSSFRGMSLAPKIFISYHYMNQTQLIKFGSTATYAYILKLNSNNDISSIQKELRIKIEDKTVKIIGPVESSRQISRGLDILADYLSLITLLTYFFSLVGLYYFTQHFLSKKVKDFSIYKTLGIKTYFLFLSSFSHLVILALIALTLSTLSITLLLPLITNYFSGLIGESLFFKLNFYSLTKILFLSIGGSLLALGPLFWGALQTPIATIFQEIPSELKRIKIIYYLPLFIYVNILAIILANSYKIGGYFLISIYSLILLASFLFKLVCILLEKSSNQINFINRHAVKTLTRHYASSFTIFICLLIGMTLTTFIFQIDLSLRSEFTQNYGNKRPDVFMFDLQDYQINEFEQFITKNHFTTNSIAPMIRARLIKINNLSTTPKAETNQNDFSTREDENSERMKNRGVNLSYRSNLSWSEKLVEGNFNGSKCDSILIICELSLEEGYAKQLKVKLNDVLTFDVSGLNIEGRVTSFRKVKWTSFEPNFFILFQPGVLEEAPRTYLASFKLSSEDEKRKLYNEMALKFPNASLIDVSAIIQKVTTLFDLMAMAIKFISILSLSVALIVLISVSFNHLDLRFKDMNLYHLVGITKNKIIQIYQREFYIIISLCIFLSLIFGSSLTYIMMKFIFDSIPNFRIVFVCTSILTIGLFLAFIVFIKLKLIFRKRNFYV